MKLTAPQVPAVLAADLVHHWRVRLAEIEDDGTLIVEGPDGRLIACHWLETGGDSPSLACGDTLLVLLSRSMREGVALGRIGCYRPPSLPEHVTVQAAQSLSLRCGSASIDLRADGKVMVKGEDVLIRAKGTQRIRAGNVAIN